MKDSWTHCRVRDVAVTYDGPHATPRSTKTATDGPIFLGISSIDSGRIDVTRSAYMSEDDFTRWTRRVTPREDDVVFSYETRLGQAAIIPKGLRCSLGRRLALMRPDTSKVDPRFLLYYFLGPQFQEVIRQNTVQGSTVDRIMLTDFPDFPIELPPMGTQKAIAQTLGALDDKIVSNQRKQELLRGIALAEYQRLNALAAEWVPLSEGYSVGLSGVWGDDQASTKSPIAIRCLRGRDLADYSSGFLPEPPVRYVSTRQWEARSPHPGEIWTAGSGTLGPSLLMTESILKSWNEPVSYSNFVKRLTPTAVMMPELAWVAVLQAEADGLFANFRTGTAMPNLDADALLRGVVVPVVDSADLERLRIAVQAFLDSRLLIENDRLRQLRDDLLTGLLAGGFAFPEAGVA